MSLLPLGPDGLPDIPEDDEISPASPQPSGAAASWLWSLCLHALLALMLMITLAPRRGGHPGAGGGSVGVITAFFRMEGDGGAPRGSEQPDVDTRLSDVLQVNGIESRGPERAIEHAVVFRTVDPNPWRQDEAPITPESEPAEPPRPDPENDAERHQIPSNSKRPREHSPAGRHVSDLEPTPVRTDDENSPPRQSGQANGKTHRKSATAGSRTGDNSHSGGVKVGRSRGTPGTSFFGVQGNGNKFVYVIDCSASMSERATYAHARQELLTSLEQLPPTALIQVIYYNDQPHAVAGGREPALVRNTAAERRKIRQLSQGIVAGGGTMHLPALEMALQLDPDVIYWLTDADEPLMTDIELRQFQHANRRRIPVHAVEFGFGPALAINNFLKRVAQQSGGKHQYYDLGATP